ncbi:hypothetical protein [Okeania sp. SIO3I5]|nr:hypothetical protein [Okeania sp. SIO3I5]
MRKSENLARKIKSRFGFATSGLFLRQKNLENEKIRKSCQKN